MSVWKEIRVSDIVRNKNGIDIGKMYRARAICEERKYRALEVQLSVDSVKVLAQLEPGFEEYLVFEKEHYYSIPEWKSD